MTRRGDAELLAEYRRDGSEAAFGELVARHRDWIYSVALRRVHDPSLAEDVCQAVFIVLARKAGSIVEGRNLPAWLFGVARFTAARAVRGESRRRRYEAAAAEMRRDEAIAGGTSAADEEMSAELDRAVAHLRAKDRAAVLLRFYERKTLAEVGEALAISEEAARKRVERAVDKLRVRLAGGNAALSGISGIWLTGWLEQHAITIAKIQADKLAATAISAAHSNSATGSAIALAKGAIRMLIWNKIKWIAVICALCALPFAVPGSLFRRAVPVQTADNQTQVAQTAPSTNDAEIHFAPTLVLTVANIQASVAFYKNLGFVDDDAPTVNSPGTQVKGGIVRIKFEQGETTDADRAARQKIQLQLQAFNTAGFTRDQFSALHDGAVAAGIKAGDIVAVNGMMEFNVVDPDGYVLVLEYQ
jgi:RNA polymerase sigma factor (sigma-70 family)